MIIDQRFTVVVVGNRTSIVAFKGVLVFIADKNGTLYLAASAFPEFKGGGFSRGRA